MIEAYDPGWPGRFAAAAAELTRWGNPAWPVEHIGSTAVLRERDGVRSHIAHFFDRRDWEQVNQRMFRDWLIAHPSDAVAYERVKRAAAAAALRGETSYSAAKTAFVQGIVDRARVERGLPLVSVSDK